MNINKRKREVQKQATKVWWKDKFGTVILHTGMGKTWLFFDCLIKSKAPNVLMFAEATVREQTIEDDRQKYKELFGIDPFEGRNVIFMCYHSAHKQPIKSLFTKGKIFVFADEHLSVVA